MKGSAKRKCLCCGDFFPPDHRNLRHQRYCPKPACRKESKAQSQRRCSLAHWQIITESESVKEPRGRSRSQSYSQIALLHSHLFLHDQLTFADISGTDTARPGEEFVVDVERRKVMRASRSDLARKVRWIAAEDGDGAWVTRAGLAGARREGWTTRQIEP